jgi:hypothetical protein
MGGKNRIKMHQNRIEMRQGGSLFKNASAEQNVALALFSM